VTFKAKETLYFHLNVPALTGSITVSLANTTKRQNSEYTWFARFQGSPSAAVHDFTAAASTFQLPSPRPGTWYFAVTSQFDQTPAFLKVASVVCSNNTIGPTCAQTPDPSWPYRMNIKTLPNVWTYWKVVVNSTHPLWASVRTVNPALLNNVQIYAAKGQLPTAQSGGGSDLANCYFPYCDGARILFLNATNALQNETWFVGTTTNDFNVTYSVWFDSICAQECTASNTGTCTETDVAPGYGVCVCVTSSLTGVDCTDHIGLGPEYIVLIIIAALVVASAVIGFVAWAYMRRKRVQYETVT